MASIKPWQFPWGFFYLHCCGGPTPYASFSTHASFRCHWWTLEQAGQSSGIMIPDSDSNLIFSVVSPVGTGTPRIGQRIMMLGILYFAADGR
jgi:hypothetical protein